ncbi:bystin [Culex quinquefasciatus]|uniref:Bystin n=1 Tax=Culex quinquefasciatus TaxID=7176 RepID=B0X665_CULQU|nr:bystin [Culex quinquefasciatus]|eukprot:XP_001865137.1 bystin [Culex quinquefasciatus]
MLRCSAALGPGRTTEPAVLLFCFGAGDIQSNGRIGLHLNLTELHNPGVGHKTSIYVDQLRTGEANVLVIPVEVEPAHPRADLEAELNLLRDLFGPLIVKEATERWWRRFLRRVGGGVCEEADADGQDFFDEMKINEKDEREMFQNKCDIFTVTSRTSNAMASSTCVLVVPVEIDSVIVLGHTARRAVEHNRPMLCPILRALGVVSRGHRMTSERKQKSTARPSGVWTSMTNQL